MVAVVVGACRPIFLSIRSSQWMIIPSHCSRTRKRTGHIHFVRGKKMGKKIRRRKRQEGRNEMGLERKDSYWAFSVCLFGPPSKRERIFQRFILVASFSLAFFFHARRGVFSSWKGMFALPPHRKQRNNNKRRTDTKKGSRHLGPSLLDWCR